MEPTTIFTVIETHQKLKEMEDSLTKIINYKTKNHEGFFPDFKRINELRCIRFGIRCGIEKIEDLINNAHSKKFSQKIINDL